MTSDLIILIFLPAKVGCVDKAINSYNLYMQITKKYIFFLAKASLGHFIKYQRVQMRRYIIENMGARVG